MTYSATYSTPTTDRLRQGELLSQVPEIVVNEGTENLAQVEREFALIITPDCDLERHAEAIEQGKRAQLRTLHLLMGVVATDRTIFPKSVWGKIRKADHAATHAIEQCPSSGDLKGTGHPALIFDFQNVFSVPIGLIYSGVEAGRIYRRSQLLSPYRDHLIQRFSAYFGRVALEENHELPKD